MTINSYRDIVESAGDNRDETEIERKITYLCIFLQEGDFLLVKILLKRQIRNDKEHFAHLRLQVNH